jgi:hypothetical protein
MRSGPTEHKVQWLVAMCSDLRGIQARAPLSARWLRLALNGDRDRCAPCPPAVEQFGKKSDWSEGLHFAVCTLYSFHHPPRATPSPGQPLGDSVPFFSSRYLTLPSSVPSPHPSLYFHSHSPFPSHADSTGPPCSPISAPYFPPPPPSSCRNKRNGRVYLPSSLPPLTCTDTWSNDCDGFVG